MIITLKGADFSNSNVGTLSTWLITKSLKGVTTDNTLTSIDKENSGYTAVFVVNDGYTLSTAKVTMGGVDITSSLIWASDETSAILTISEVTGNVVISIVAVSESGEEVPDTGGETPTVTTWYVDHRNNASAFSSSVNIAGRGWCHVPSTPAYKAYVGKPVNAIGFFSNLTSQTVTIMKVPEKGGVDAGTIIATVTATGSGSKEFVYVTFPTVTLAEGECLAAFAQDDSNINFYYASGSSVTDANGIADGNFYGRVPKVYGSGTAWTSYTSSICLGWSIGYVV